MSSSTHIGSNEHGQILFYLQQAYLAIADNNAEKLLEWLELLSELAISLDEQDENRTKELMDDWEKLYHQQLEQSEEMYEDLNEDLNEQLSTSGQAQPIEGSNHSSGINPFKEIRGIITGARTSGNKERQKGISNAIKGFLVAKDPNNVNAKLMEGPDGGGMDALDKNKSIEAAAKDVVAIAGEGHKEVNKALTYSVANQKGVVPPSPSPS